MSSAADVTRLIPVGDQLFTASEVLSTLSPFLSAARALRIREAVQQRITQVSPVLEGLFDRGNASAVMRSAEGLGYQHVHIIDTSENFKESNRVTQGAEKWLDVHVWPDTRECLGTLKQSGCKVYVTHLKRARDLRDIAFDGPALLVFGNEKEGVSETALEFADERVQLPMWGFSQSFNISVAAALCLFHIREERLRRLGVAGDVPSAEQLRFEAEFYLRAVEHAEAILLRARGRKPATHEAGA